MQAILYKKSFFMEHLYFSRIKIIPTLTLKFSIIHHDNKCKLFYIKKSFFIKKLVFFRIKTYISFNVKAMINFKNIDNPK